jgi:hypothetical protein
MIMNDPIKMRKVLTCMAITAIIKNKKKLLSCLLSSFRFFLEINLSVRQINEKFCISFIILSHRIQHVV